MSAEEANSFFLKEESYCNFDLPTYFSFNKLLIDTQKFLQGKSIESFFGSKDSPSEHEDVNYTILNNKDGQYGWRRLELINPALYVALVELITDKKSWQLILKKFKDFSNNKSTCFSIPVCSISKKSDQAEQILNWWAGVEQASLKLSIEYDHLIQIDLTDCYGSIYTHAIGWALHGKSTAKANKNSQSYLLGDSIDKLIRHMRNGQTNGIPQGSVLMDFIAEIVLGYLDSEISKRIAPKEKYRIIRYRDDYRIFINDLSLGKRIVKVISECTEDVGLKINNSKTQISKNVISDSIKKDKLAWLMLSKDESSFQKQLLLIHQHSLNHPNSGSIITALTYFHKRLLKRKSIEDAESQISIVVDISFHSPKTYPIATAIISKLLSTISNEKVKRQIIKKIQSKFLKIPNTGHMEIWLQRVTRSLNPCLSYDEKLCKLVNSQKVELWNNNWTTSSKLKLAMNPNKVIVKAKLQSIKPVIQVSEVDLFATNY